VNALENPGEKRSGQNDDEDRVGETPMKGKGRDLRNEGINDHVEVGQGPEASAPERGLIAEFPPEGGFPDGGS